jgi:uncharacterized protein (DUF983 family)
MTKPHPARGDKTLAPGSANPLRARCPRCGKGRLYAGFLSLPPACEVCRLDYSPFRAGDGPAVFVILIVGAIVAGGALITEVAYKPPYWVHAAIWGPAILVLSLGFLRPLKTWLIVQQYKHRAEEARQIPSPLAGDGGARRRKEGA